jgi:hypothetical protein
MSFDVACRYSLYAWLSHRSMSSKSSGQLALEAVTRLKWLDKLEGLDEEALLEKFIADYDELLTLPESFVWENPYRANENITSLEDGLMNTRGVSSIIFFALFQEMVKSLQAGKLVAEAFVEGHQDSKTSQYRVCFASFPLLTFYSPNDNGTIVTSHGRLFYWNVAESNGLQ